MERSYIGAVCKEDGSFGIVFRDFPGCVSAGDTLEEVLRMGAEALSGHVAAMRDGGDPIPEPTDHDLAMVVDWLRDDADDHAIDEGWVGMFPITVDVEEDPQLVTITMRADLVRRIADMAQVRAHKLDSRAFIELAVERELDGNRKSAA